MKVCEKVQMKGTTSYNEVATELVHEIIEKNQQQGAKSHDEKNIRRRVYDALNVLMALNIISKDKKEIRWKGLPVNYHQEYDHLQTMKQQHQDSINLKSQQLNELLRQQRALGNLYQRNAQPEFVEGNPRVELPFIVVQTANETLIDCEMDQDGYVFMLKRLTILVLKYILTFHYHLKFMTIMKYCIGWDLMKIIKNFSNNNKMYHQM